MARIRNSLIAGLVGLVALIHAQALPPVTLLPPVTQAPPPIAFPRLQTVDVNEDYGEYFVSFPSPVVTPYPANNVVPLRIFLPPGGRPAPVVLILHYWGANDLKLERTLAEELNLRGVAAAIMTLPYHLSRTPPGSHSGALAITPDPDHLMESMIQSVMDARRALDFLATVPQIRMDKVGISGTSLGAIVTGLVAAVDPRITHASFLLGGVDLAHIIWTSSLLVTVRDQMRRRGLTEERLKATLEPIEPSNYLKIHRPASSFVVGGQFDTVVPRQCTQDLIDVLGTRNYLWIGTGHYGGIFVEHRLLREVATYFGTSFSGGSFDAPLKLYAPTIRVGFKVDSVRGLDIGIGIDLFQLDRRGDMFSTFFLTPRGPELFAGYHFGEGISVGFTASSPGLGVGLLWSTVL